MPTKRLNPVKMYIMLNLENQLWILHVEVNIIPELVPLKGMQSVMSETVSQINIFNFT